MGGKARSAVFAAVVVLAALGARPVGAGLATGTVSDPDDVGTPLDIEAASLTDASTVTVTVETYEAFSDEDACIDGEVARGFTRPASSRWLARDRFRHRLCNCGRRKRSSPRVWRNATNTNSRPHHGWNGCVSLTVRCYRRDRVSLTARSNALMESTIGLYKTELIDFDPRRSWSGRAEVERETAEWVHWFNTTRIHHSIGKQSPIEFEDHYRHHLVTELGDVA